MTLPISETEKADGLALRFLPTELGKHPQRERGSGAACGLYRAGLPPAHSHAALAALLSCLSVFLNLLEGLSAQRERERENTPPPGGWSRSRCILSPSLLSRFWTIITGAQPVFQATGPRTQTM